MCAVRDFALPSQGGIKTTPKMEFGDMQSISSRASSFDIFLSADADHEIPDVIFPPPREFLRGKERVNKVSLRLVDASECIEFQKDSTPVYLPLMKAAIGRELCDGKGAAKPVCNFLRHDMVSSWSFILD
jgi:hypothetical protein